MLPSRFEYCLCSSDDWQSLSDAPNMKPASTKRFPDDLPHHNTFILAPDCSRPRIPAQDAMAIEPRRSLRLHPISSPPLKPAATPKKRQYIEISSIECSPINKPPARTQRNTDVSPIPAKEKATRSKKKNGTKPAAPVKTFVDVAVGPDDVCSPNDTLYEGIQMMKDAFGMELTCSLCCKI
jgi:hypothetical protein